MKADELSNVSKAEPPDASEDSSAVKEFALNGIAFRIRPTIKGDTTYFVLDYRVQGKRKLVWRSSMAKARAAAKAATDKIIEGQAEVLNLKSADAHAYTRARAALDGRDGETKIEKEIDEVAREYAEIYRMLGGRASPLEVTRDWLKRNAVVLPRITVADAVAEFKLHCVADGKSVVRRKEISTILTNFAEFFNVEIHTLEPKMIADYLTALVLAERTRRNYRNVIGFFNRWLVLRGYLAKRTDWLEGVQNYSMRQQGEITIYTADEMRRLIAAADDRILPLIVIGGFAGLRHSEIVRLDWQEIDLADGFIEVKPIEGTKSDQRRRIVPIKDNLKAFLLPLSKKNGKVITVKNTSKELGRTAANTGDEAAGIKALEWKHNAPRHTYISARVAESGDVPRVADEAGNSPYIIRTNYLKRMRPVTAAEWFAILPKDAK